MQGIFAESPDRVFILLRGELPVLERPEEIPYSDIGPSLSFPVSATPFRNASVGPVTSPGNSGSDGWNGWQGTLGVDARWEHCLIVVDSAAAFPAVPGFSLDENAAFGVSYLTAWICLMEMARLRTTDRVLVTAAAGGLGTAAVQIASRFGCEVIALAGSEKKLEKARELGADVTVRYGDSEFPRRLAEAVGPAGVDVVLETVGGDVFTACDAVVAPFGRVIVAGYAELDYKLWNPISCWKAWNGRPRMRLESMLKGSKGLLSAHLGYLLQDAALVKRVWSDLSAFAEEHTIRPVVGHVLTLDEVAAAHRLMESRASVGKIVLRV